MVVKKRGRPGFRDGKKPPRRAGFRTGVAFDKNAMKSIYTMQKYRNGFYLLWRFVGKYMKRIGMKKPGEYHGLELHTRNWKVQSLAVEKIESSFFDDRDLFPAGSADFDCALLMRQIDHEWQERPMLCCQEAG